MKTTVRTVDEKPVDWTDTGKQRDENRTGVHGHYKSRIIRKQEKGPEAEKGGRGRRQQNQ